MAEVAARISGLVRSTGAQVVFGPLAVGRHVDHLIVRTVMQHLDTTLVYYSDFPYNLSAAPDTFFTEQHGLVAWQWSEGAAAKEPLIRAYKTQADARSSPAERSRRSRSSTTAADGGRCPRDFAYTSSRLHPSTRFAADCAALPDSPGTLVLVNGEPGILAWNANGNPRSVMACTVVDGRIVEILSVSDPERLAAMDLPERPAQRSQLGLTLGR